MPEQTPNNLGLISFASRNSAYAIAIVIIFIHLLLVGCKDQSLQNQSAATNPASSSPAVEPIPTQTVVADVARTPAIDFATGPMASPTVAADIAKTPATDFAAGPLASPTVDPAVFGQAEEYRIYINYTLDDDLASDASSLSPPDGMVQIVIVATVENNSYESLEIKPESLTLIGSQNERFQADVSDEQLQPSLAGARLKPGESLLGFIKFTVPGEVIPEVIQWCPSNNSNCDRPLTAPIS